MGENIFIRLFGNRDSHKPMEKLKKNYIVLLESKG